MVRKDLEHNEKETKKEFDIENVKRTTFKHGVAIGLEQQVSKKLMLDEYE
jgi:hypothetical protein